MTLTCLLLGSVMFSNSPLNFVVDGNYYMAAREKNGKTQMKFLQNNAEAYFKASVNL